MVRIGAYSRTVLAPLAAFGDEIGVLSGLTDEVGRSVDEIAEVVHDDVATTAAVANYVKRL